MLPQKDEDPKVDETPVVVARLAVPEKFVMTIVNNGFETKAVFVKNEEGEWTRHAGADVDDATTRTKTPQPVPVVNPGEKTN